MVLRENCPLIPIQKAYSCSWAAETWPITRARQQPALKPIICVAQRDSGRVKRENTSIHTCCCRVTWAPLHSQLVRLSINKHHALSLSLGTPCEYQTKSHPSLRKHGVQLTEKVLPPHPSEWFICIAAAPANVFKVFSHPLLSPASPGHSVSLPPPSQSAALTTAFSLPHSCTHACLPDCNPGFPWRPALLSFTALHAVWN